MHKFTPAGPPKKNTTAKSLVEKICNQLSNIKTYIFRHCGLLDLNKIHEKKLQAQNYSFTDCHTEGLVVKTN